MRFPLCTTSQRSDVACSMYVSLLFRVDYVLSRTHLQQVSPGGICFRAKPGWTWDYIVQSPLHGALAMLRWLAFGSGPMGALCAQAAVFTRSDDKR